MAVLNFFWIWVWLEWFGGSIFAARFEAEGLIQIFFPFWRIDIKSSLTDG